MSENPNTNSSYWHLRNSGDWKIMKDNLKAAEKKGPGCPFNLAAFVGIATILGIVIPNIKL